MKLFWALTLCVTCASFVSYGQAARILGLFAFPGKSHFSAIKVLMEGLAKKGHNVTVVSFFPHENPPPGYTDISLDGLIPAFTNAFDLENIPGGSLPLWVKSFVTLKMLSGYGYEHCETLLPSAPIQQLLKAKGEYDIAITEFFHTDCFLAVLHKLEVPYIGISSSTMMPFHNRRFANPMDPSAVNNILIGESTRMDLCSRIINSIVNFVWVVFMDVFQYWPADRIVRKHMGDDIPSVKTLAHNTSLMLLNSHFSFHQPRPLVPGVIEIGGIHVQPPKPLPKDLEEFVQAAKDGVIVFSMGSVLNPATMSKEKKDAFINTFKKLKQRIIWKISGDIGELPSNVYVMNWIPQKDLLAHPNVKGFIGHGGLGGMLETIVAGTPYISIPMFGDQFTNVRSGVDAGVAVELSFKNITEASVTDAIRTILSDKYQANAKKLAKQFLDRPLSPLDTAIYWVEYILKYGPNAVRSQAVDLCDVEYYLIDLFVIFGVAILVTTCLVKCVVKKLASKLCRLVCKPKTEKIKKQ